MSARTLILVAFASTLSGEAFAGHVFDLGAGWQNTGATRELGWEPAVQGSRKDVPLFVGWRYVGETRVYWSPLVRFGYTNFWSLGGAGNLLGVTLAPAGLGVYLTRPPARIPRAERKGRWFAAIDLNLGVQLGGNVSPDSPQDPRVPDAEAHRDRLRNEIATQGHVSPASGFTQHYPLGSYSFAQLGLSTQIRAWNMVNQRVGVGFFLEVTPFFLEWPLDRAVNLPANGYAISGGLSVTRF